MLRIPRAAPVVVVLVVLGTLGAALFFRLAREQTIAIRVGGAEERVAAGTTVAEAAERFALHPAAGSVLDVEGAVLRRGAYPGRILLNGRAVSGTVALQEGDHIRVVDGRSHREPTRRVFVRVAGGVPADPQFTLSRAPGEEMDVGRLSKKADPHTVEPSGAWHVSKAVALTFDDGPSTYTRRVLAILERMHARATFFVVGRSAERFPRLVRREVALGMQVGNHSYSHPYSPPFDRRPRSRIVEEIARGADVLAPLGARPTVFRPPGGSYSDTVLEVGRSLGERVVLWSVDPEDWRSDRTAKELTHRVLENVHAGSIVVLHDGGGDQSATVQALPGIVRGIRAKGLGLELVDPHGR
jgi:peptidoglycan/xylan/chitin deacetylase (PgdA/CDA1 family)/sulfur carrier protein ThiS